MNTTSDKPRNYTLECLRRIEDEIATLTLHLDFVTANRERLEALNIRLNYYSTFVDFERLERPDVLRVIKAFPGHWENPKLRREVITLVEPEGELTLRLWVRAPDCCHIEDVEYVEVPADRAPCHASRQMSRPQRRL